MGVNKQWGKKAYKNKKPKKRQKGQMQTETKSIQYFFRTQQAQEIKNVRSQGGDQCQRFFNIRW